MITLLWAGALMLPGSRSRPRGCVCIPWKTGVKPPLLLLERDNFIFETGPKRVRYIQRMKCLWVVPISP